MDETKEYQHAGVETSTKTTTMKPTNIMLKQRAQHSGNARSRRCRSARRRQARTYWHEQVHAHASRCVCARALLRTLGHVWFVTPMTIFCIALHCLVCARASVWHAKKWPNSHCRRGLTMTRMYATIGQPNSTRMRTLLPLGTRIIIIVVIVVAC